MIATATDFDRAAWPLEAVVCNLCGGTDHETIATTDRYGWPVTTVACVSCGLRFINPRMVADGYAAFYAHGYRPLLATVGAPSSQQMIRVDQKVYLAHLLPALRGWAPRGADLRVLDIGGSTGFVGRAVRQVFGYGSVTVIDPSAEELAEAKDCTTICGSAETIDPFPHADLALLCRTVEHLLDPATVLRRIAQASPRLVVDAMHVEGWPARWRYKVDHPYAFTADTLAALLDRCGWSIDKTWWRRDRQYVGYLCTRKDSH